MYVVLSAIAVPVTQKKSQSLQPAAAQTNGAGEGGEKKKEKKPQKKKKKSIALIKASWLTRKDTLLPQRAADTRHVLSKANIQTTHS